TGVQTCALPIFHTYGIPKKAPFRIAHYGLSQLLPAVVGIFIRFYLPQMRHHILVLHLAHYHSVSSTIQAYRKSTIIPGLKTVQAFPQLKKLTKAHQRKKKDTKQ